MSFSAQAGIQTAVSRDACAVTVLNLRLPRGRQRTTPSRNFVMAQWKWAVVIGLETHVQLTTRSKIFSAAAPRLALRPIRRRRSSILALPGALPVMNRGAVERAVRFGLAIGAKINQRSIMARKNYFTLICPRAIRSRNSRRLSCRAVALTITLDDGATKFIELTAPTSRKTPARACMICSTASPASTSTVPARRCSRL